MRIAQVAPLAEAVPPKLYGGTERVVSYLTEELVAMGHDVTLFASGDSKTSAELVPMTRRALRLDTTARDWVAPHIGMIETVARRSHEFDVIHVHIDHLHLPLFTCRGLPFVTTLHGRLDMPELASLFTMFADAPFVSISDAQRRPLPSLNWVGTVHHGLPEGGLLLSRRAEGYLAFLGRISPEKRPDRAISIARRAGLPLKIAAKVDNADQAYFAAVIEPMLRESAGQVELVGEIAEAQKGAFLGGAAALLFPVDWPEPFGLVMIEAMACGTPVIAYPHGSVPEVITQGVTGFMVEDEIAAVEAVEQACHLDRARIRGEFERRFTARRMAEDYVRIYERIVQCARPPLAVAAE
jgi:glycosyltransferase involved in cell wall biosynthesis